MGSSSVKAPSTDLGGMMGQGSQLLGMLPAGPGLFAGGQGIFGTGGMGFGTVLDPANPQLGQPFRGSIWDPGAALPQITLPPLVQMMQQAPRSYGGGGDQMGIMQTLDAYGLLGRPATKQSVMAANRAARKGGSTR